MNQNDASGTEAVDVEPGVFAFLDSYAENLSEESGGKEDADVGRAINFCQAFFAQFMKNVAGLTVTSFDSATQERAAERRLELQAKGASPRILNLIAWCEKFCAEQRDVTTQMYLNDEDEDGAIREFNEIFIPGLLQKAQAWADEAGRRELVSRIDQSIQKYDAALAEFYE